MAALIPPPHGLAEIKALFGAPSFHPLKPPFVDIDDAWERENLVVIPDAGGTGLRIQLHKLVARQFEEAMVAARKAAPDYKVRLLGGYCARQMVTLDPAKQAAAPLSVHAWGAAFDVNWDTNPFRLTLKTDLPPAFVKAFTDAGWDWGGNWRSKKDPMHFQYATGY